MQYENRSTVVVYDDPITETRPCFKAIIVGCVDKNVGTIEGRRLRRYLVLPTYEGAETCEMNLLDAKST